MASYPNYPAPGKNSTVLVSSNDGLPLVLEEMEKQASYNYRGEQYANRVYLLGAGKTMLNMRPALQPVIYVNGIIEGLNLLPGSADNQVAVSAGTIEVNGEIEVVAADAALALTNSTADKCWNAIVVDKTTQALSVIKGTDGANLLDTYGDGAGQRPLIPLNDLLIGWVEVGTADYTVLSTDINYQDREIGGLDYEILPNIGGALLPFALQEIHSATIGGTPSARVVQFTGNYLDDVMTRISTASEWALNSESDDSSESTFQGGYRSGTVSGFNLTFNQLIADKKIVDAVNLRQGYCAIRALFPNGFGWQAAATVSFNITNPATGFSSQSVTAQLLDFPAEYTGE